ncbi:hypothetical protein PUMCH_004902 [Australozyma saopauloensis]|uniref:TECPR1-like DysF domain-containing protein n=1 Tax=Australozyma saopauloensis TaxID=291208 RepID=A0AAX4HGI2_9ASCO|nr:hypothetical protein PUMCH_004902 [[Candida] saopauloensis]
MDQVTNFLESIIAVEQPPSTESAGTENAPQAKLTPKSLPKKVIRRSSSSYSITEPEKPNDVSSFWYLEDDHKKVANQMTDRLIERVLNVIIDPLLVGPGSNDTRVEIHNTRPPFSINLMTLNSIKFAQRVSPVFEAIDDATYMMCWKDPYLTVGVLLMATLVVLRPYLLTAVPPFMLLKHFMVPHYMRLHTPDPLFVDGKYTWQNPIPSEGRPLDKFEAPKPAPQLSREFLMNFTDMQNHLVPYIRLYDAAVSWGQHYFLFEDFELSSVVYLLLCAVILVNLFIVPLALPLLLKVFPAKAMLIISLWSAAITLHPKVRGKLLDSLYTEEARLSRLNKTDKMETKLMSALVPEDPNSPVDTKEVEVYELHRLSAKHIWEPIGFTNDFFALNHPLRAKSVDADGKTIPAPAVKVVKSDDEEEKIVLPDIPRKATILEIKAPQNWTFTESDWQIDFEPLEWVKSNYIMDLVNVDADEKWVYDFVDGDKPPDGFTYRRRRWVRLCQRETAAQKRAREALIIATTTNSDRFGKTIGNLLA